MAARSRLVNCLVTRAESAIRLGGRPRLGVNFCDQSCAWLTCGPAWAFSSIGASTRPREIGGGFAAPGGARQALTPLVPGGPARIVGTYSSNWMRPSKVRLLIMSSATSG
jgi:hypothetical protein